MMDKDFARAGGHGFGIASGWPDMMSSDFARRIACTLLICLMLNLCFEPAFAQNLPRETIAPEGQPVGSEGFLLETIAPEGQPVGSEGFLLETIALEEQPVGEGLPEINVETKTGEFVCSSPESDPNLNNLSPAEVAALKRVTEIENKGFAGDNINSGRGENKDRDKLENDVIVQTADDGTAVANQVPAGKMDTGEFPQLFNQYIVGPFAFGVSLEDTIRVGQCRYPERLNENERGCPVEDRQQSLRNSGAGITADVKLAWQDLRDWIGIDAITGNTGQYTAEQLENLQAKAALEDVDSLQAKGFKRETKLIGNSVKTDDFTANMVTTGSSAASLISVYSMFDKYFNSWFSTDLVISNFGPTLFGQAKKYAGWLKRRGLAWDMSDNKFMQWFRRTFYDPEGLLGEARLKRMTMRNNKYGFGEFMQKGVEYTEWDSGYVFVKGHGWRTALNEWGKPGGMFDQMTDPVVRGEFFKQVSDLRATAHANKAIYSYYDEAYKNAKDLFGAASPEAKAAFIDSARSNSRLMLKMDDDWLRLDATELWVKEEVTGLYNKGLKVKATGNFVPTTGDSKPMGKVQRAFADTGLFEGTDFAATPEGFLEIYKIDPAGEFISETAIEDIKKNFSRYVDKAALTEKGDMIMINSTSLDYIASEASGTGKVKIYKANWVLDHAETPEMYASRMKNIRADRIAYTFSQNMDRIHAALIERNFAGQSRRYYSILDKAFAQEQEILKSYFSVKGGAKWTLMPFLYWGGKQGFGYEALSAYQLPDTWKKVELSTEDEEIFDDAFIDVFAQEGSDEGDIFVQVLNKLPWKMVLNKVSEEFNLVDNAYKQLTTPLSGWRREVENVAYFTSTSQECATCSARIAPVVDSQQALEELVQKGRGQATISFNAQDEMSAYFVEDILKDETKKDGTTLIAFGHHTNIEGEAVSEEDNIDLIQAKKDEKRCQDAVKEIGMGFLGDDPQRAAAILSFGESLGYVVFLWSGIILSVVQQTLLVPKLQDCVDDVDGYFVHMFSPYDEKKESVETPNEKGSQKAGDVVQVFNELVLGKEPAKVKEKEENKEDKAPVDEKGQPFTPAAKKAGEEFEKDKTVVNRPWEAQQQEKSILELAKERIATEAEKLSQKAKSKEILQIGLETKGKTNGNVSFKNTFFIWFKGYTQQAAYDNTSKYLVEDNKNDVALAIDKEKGSIIAQKEGKPAEELISGKEQVRMADHDTRVPAEVIPQRIGTISLPSGPAVELFEMDYKGKFTVLEPSVLDCIRRNVEEQTGVPLTTNDISEAFGAIKSILTDSYDIMPASLEDRSITANGAPRETVYGEDARVLVMSDMKTTLLGDKEVPVGSFQSAQFKNGIILYKPATAEGPAELIIWLRYHERSILRNSDVAGLKAKLAEPIINPETGCPETAIDLEAIANLAAGEDSQITERVENFNNSIKKMGPFQVFETDRHRFVFYSQKTSPECSPTEQGCCQERVSIIDKKTGDVYDQAIVGGVQQTPTGIKFTTADGKDHTLDFSADNGIPKISYNGMVPETLLSARGPNGGFWYDPENGQWYPYNAQMLPLVDEFKKGIDTRHREECSSSSLPGGNVMNLQVGGAAETPFNLPSMPAEPIAMLLFVFSLMAAICISRNLIERKFQE